MKSFKQYSKSKCMFQYRIIKAAAVCGCIPWNYQEWMMIFPFVMFMHTTVFRTQCPQPSECSCFTDCASATYITNSLT